MFSITVRLVSITDIHQKSVESTTLVAGGSALNMFKISFVNAGFRSDDKTFFGTENFFPSKMLINYMSFLS